jgi:hypothetical protein
MNRLFLGCALSLLAVLGSSHALRAADSSGPAITYRKIFKSSSPEFVEIKVRENAEAATFEIRQLDEDPGAAPFAVSAPLRTKIFALAGELNHFRGQDLDVHRKIANLGEKTFRWENGRESYEAKFNYTLNSAATQLLRIFEGLARQQDLLILLQRRMKYDRLGINDALLQFDTDFTKGVIPEPQRALPLLDQIANDSQFVEIARQRARSLSERIRNSG